MTRFIVNIAELSLILFLQILLYKKSDPFKSHLPVGMTGFEPATPSSRTKYATGLRYIPNDKFKNQVTKITILLKVEQNYWALNFSKNKIQKMRLISSM